MKPGMKLTTSLGLWMGIRMCILAAFAVGGAATGMWAYFQFKDHQFMSGLSPEVRAEVARMRERPEDFRSQLWAHIHEHYDVQEFFPGLSNPDWLMVAVMLTCELPFLVLFGVMTARPISRHIRELAGAARQVAEGNFNSRARLQGRPPREIAALAADFNDMTAKLEHFERELRESSAMMAHELRTPLNAAMGRTQGMLDDVFPRDAQQLEMVLRQLLQIKRLVGDLHLLSLAQAGRLHLEFEVFSLLDLVRERVVWAETELARVGVECRVGVPASALVRADRDRIGQVASILIDNAIRYAADGRSVDIRAAAASSGTRLVIADRGLGVDPSSIDRMTDRFWRADESRTRNSGGSGLGLAIAEAVCRAHGGALTLRARHGGGLEAEILLPDNGSLDD
jgi:signal transduction histidine kinase